MAASLSYIPLNGLHPQPTKSASSSSEASSRRRNNAGSEQPSPEYDRNYDVSLVPQATSDRRDMEANARGFQTATQTISRRLSEPFSETDTIIGKQLGVRDLASLVFNKMVGTGIFTVPGHVLKATGSKKISIVLWAAGGVYTAFCLTAYLELGKEFAFDGGELIYLDRTLPCGFLWTLAFATFFITIANTSGNAIAFARFVMLAALPTETSLDSLDQKVVKLIAINIVSVVCLLHYLLRDLGRILNQVLALYKFCLLVGVIIAGFIASGASKAGLADGEGQTAESKLSAVVLVLYSFTGWENANYVAGEISTNRQGDSSRKLPVAAYSAIVSVTVLYVLVAISYYLAFTYEDITKLLDLGMARKLGPLVRTYHSAFKPGGVSLDILFALSAFGNLIAVVYTSSRVKQAIARQRILPFWQYLEKDPGRTGTPKGGLFLHWLFTTIMILAAPVGPDGYSFVVGLYTYGQVVVVTATVIGLLVWLEKKAKSGHWTSETYPFSRRPVAYFIIAVVVVMNILVLVMASFLNRKNNIKQIPVPGWLWPIVTFTIYGGGLIWFLILLCLQNDKFGGWVGVHVHVHEVNTREVRRDATAGLNGIATGRAGNPLSEDLQRALVAAKEDGTNRRLEVTLTRIPAKIDNCLRYIREKLSTSDYAQTNRQRPAERP